MWVFGYGSLMWDSWESQFNCTSRVLVELHGYRRVFNKASTRNWGTKALPGPTLNLVEDASSVCKGFAFEFPEVERQQILEYLRQREGSGFQLLEVVVFLESDLEVVAYVSFYSGNNLIQGKSLDEITDMVLAATGTSGACLEYVKGIKQKLEELRIFDPAVTSISKKLNLDKFN